MNKLHTLYRDILSFAGFVVGDDDSLKINLNGREFPADINGKIMKFPSETALRSFDSEREVMFHPLQEFVGRGESDVVRKLRRVINIRLNLSTLSLIDALMDVLATQANHSKMSPQQREIIKQVDVIDNTLRAEFMSACTAAFAENPDSLFVNIFTKKSGTYRGEKHARVGIVSFPALENQPESMKKITKAKWEKIRQLMLFIFPDAVSDPEAYNSFSDSTDCAWLGGLLNTSINLADRLNELWNIYSEFIEDDKKIKFNMDWVDGFSNLDAYRKEIMLIPSQRGNEGEVESEVAKPTPAPSPAATISMDALAVPAARTAPVAQPVAQPAPRPGPIYGDAVQPLPGAAAQPVPRKTAEGKVSIDDLVPSTPQVMHPGMPQQFVTPMTIAATNAQQMAYANVAAHSPSMAQAMMAQCPMPQAGVMTPWGIQPVQPQVQPAVQAVTYDAYGRAYDQFGRLIAAAGTGAMVGGGIMPM